MEIPKPNIQSPRIKPKLNHTRQRLLNTSRERESMKLKIRYLSLFSGIGGFEYGLQKSTRYNFECVGYSEVDNYAEKIYQKHYPNHPKLGDVTQINTEDLPQFDFLVGGFPCQAFSIAGQRRGFDDCRGTLFFEIARILKDKRPRYFLLENVRGLLSHNKGETFQTILGVLSDLGYDVKWEILNSKNFGVPQRRERVFIKGYSRERCRGEVLCQREHDEEHYISRVDNKKGLEQGKTRMTQYYIKLRETTSKGYRETYPYDGVELSRKGCTTRRGVSHDGMTGSLNTSDGSWGVLMNDYRIRKLTPTECERLQGFPDGWTEEGSDGSRISDTQRYKCLGNAVTTNVITWIVDNWDFKVDNDGE